MLVIADQLCGLGVCRLRMPDRDEDRIVRQLVELLRREFEQSQASLLLRIGDHALHGAEGKRSSDDPTRRTPKAEAVAEPEGRLSVRSQIRFLDEAATALKDDCIGFTLARDFDPREIGLLYYVMASSQTLGDALKRVARYSKITNEALVFGYREGNRLIISLSYSGVPRHSDRHQIEFCMFAAIRICRVLTGRTSYRNTSRFLMIGREAPPTWRDLSERKWSSALTQTSLP